MVFGSPSARMALRIPFALAVLGMSAATAHAAVNPDDPQSVRDAYAATIVANEQVRPGWTGSAASCNPGTESPASAAATIANVNFYRQMNRLAPVTLASATVNAKAQAAALMFEANSNLSHDPPSSWKCYTSEGAAAAARSDIALGISGAATIPAYIEDEGDYNQAVGHRRWILFPQARSFGTGSTTNANALWVIDAASGSRPASDIVAWPPKGYVPWPLMYRRWSVSSNLAPDADYANATISVVSGGTRLAVKKLPVHDGYADNTVAFEVTIPSAIRAAEAETAFDVTVGNVVVNGSARTLTYRTTAIPADATNAPTAVQATVTDDDASITWQAPGSPTDQVTGYRVALVDYKGAELMSQELGADARQFDVADLPQGFYRADVRTMLPTGQSTPGSRLFTVGNPVVQSLIPAASAIRAVRVVRTGTRIRLARISLRANAAVSATVQRWNPWQGRWVAVRKYSRRGMAAGVRHLKIGRLRSGRYRVIVVTPATAARKAARYSVRFRVG